ncbi:MAG: hypothetical protein R3F37_07425 [Candidatus Competibacteraceae bacterium]
MPATSWRSLICPGSARLIQKTHNAQHSDHERSQRFLTAFFWTLLWSVAVLALYQGSDSIALIDPNEGRNASIALENGEVRKDYIVPHLNGLPYLDKPVFFFAAAATAIRQGATEFAARLPSLAFTLATICW